MTTRQVALTLGAVYAAILGFYCAWLLYLLVHSIRRMWQRYRVSRMLRETRHQAYREWKASQR